MKLAFCHAIHERRLMRLSYGYHVRVIEPHIYGVNRAGHELLRAFQTWGISKSGESRGWKLLRVDQISGFEVMEEGFRPRPDYQRDDPDIDRNIYCQL